MIYCMVEYVTYDPCDLAIVVFGELCSFLGIIILIYIWFESFCDTSREILVECGEEGERSEVSYILLVFVGNDKL